MKTNLQLLMTTALMAVSLPTSAPAIEAPADDSPPPQITRQTKPGGMVDSQAPFIGILADDIPELLADHIGLNPGDGVMVKAVIPDGPAAKAGIRNHDIITCIEDREIRSPKDLTQAVSTRKPGDSIRIQLIQKGKPNEIRVTLENRPSDMVTQPSEPLQGLHFKDVPSDMTERMKHMIEENLRGFENPFRNLGRLGMDEEIEQSFQNLRMRMQKSMDEAENPGDNNGIQFQQNATVKVLDQDGSVEIQSSNGHSEVTVRDKGHKVVWSGPWNSDQDKAAAPDNIRSRVDRLNLDTSPNGGGIRLRMNSSPEIEN